MIEILGPIFGALVGLYYFVIRIDRKSVKNELCIKRVEGKLDDMNDINYIKEEITDLKDAVRMLK